MSPPSSEPTVEDLRETPRLSAPQRRFLAHFARTRFRRLVYLTGGAALSAAYLGHRASDDLDLFGPDPVPIKALVRWMKGLEGLDTLQWLLPKDRTTFLVTWDDGSAVKVEYRHFPYAPWQTPHALAGLYVDSLPDLLANKLYALVERRYELDRIDVYMTATALGLTGPNDLGEAIEAAEAKFDLPRGSLDASVRRRLAAPLPEQTPDALHAPLDLDALRAWIARSAL